MVEAKGLPAMDRSGTSDPYVYIITDQNEKLRTPYISKTLNPLWNKSFSVFVLYFYFFSKVQFHINKKKKKSKYQ